MLLQIGHQHEEQVFTKKYIKGRLSCPGSVLFFLHIHVYVASRLEAIVIIFSNFFTCCFRCEKHVITQVTNWKLPFGRGKRVTSQDEREARL